MSQSKKSLIFALIIVGAFALGILLQFLSLRNGVNYPKWPLIAVVVIAYYSLFPKKKDEQK